MKKLLFSLILLLVSYVGFSQKGLTYQAVILDPSKIEIPGQDISGQPFVNGDVWMKFSIYNGSTLQFEEVQKTKTDEYGLVNLIIGSVSSASFNALVWDASQKSLQVFVSFNQGASYTKVSDQKLNYNPYAFYAETSGKLGGVLAISGGGTGATTIADARVNLGLGNVDNTSDAAKPISTATKVALDLKANKSELLAGLAGKADTATIKTFVVNQVATATISDADANTKGKIQLAGDLAGTASAPTVPGLALKANTADMTTALALKANSADMTTALALKANAANVTTALSVKADTAYVLYKVAAATIADADANTKGKIQLAGDLAGTAAAPTVPGLALKLDANQKGVANGVASLNAQGIIPTSQLPPVTLSSTNVVGSDADMTALSSATVGSIAVRTDVNKNFVLSNLPASNLANWIELLTPAAPVQAVNGYTGSVNLAKSDVGLSNVDNTSDVSKPVSNPTQAALNLKLDANKVGAASGVASLNALGKIPTDQIPAISFSSVKVLNSQADMLALSTAVIGSVVIRTDVNKNYVLAAANPAVLANWIELLTPAPPVQTVNGMSGNISLAKSDLGLGNADNTSDANKPISTATQTALDLKANSADISSALNLKANIASPTFTGTVTTGSLSSTSITAPTYASTPKTLTYTGSTINWNPAQGLNAAITLTQNSALSFTTAPPVGSYGTVVLTQDGTGGRTLSLPVVSGATNKVLGSTSTSSVALSSAANSKDILNFYYDGTNCYWNIGQGYGAAGSSGTTNLASNVTGTLGVANGGTGATTATAALTSLGAAPVASPTFTGTVTTSAISTGALSATSVNTPIYASTPQVLTAGSSINWNPALGLNASVTLAQNSTLSFTSTPTAGAYGTLVVTQGTGGNFTLTLPSTTNKVLGSTSSTTVALSTSAGAKDIVNFYFDGTNCYWNVGQGYGSASTFTATNIAGGASGSIPYQTGSGSTSLLAKGTDGQILTLASGIPSWAAAPVTGVTSASSPLTISSNALSLGTVPVANGGTGATTANAAFNALSPMTTSGDIIYGGISGAGTRLAKGTDGQVLQLANGLPTWANSSTSGLLFVTTNNNLGIGDNKTLASATGGTNIAIGSNALGNYYTGGISGSNNVGIGKDAGDNNTSGSGNIYLGIQAGITNQTGSSNTFIGYNTTTSANQTTPNSVSNSIAIGANAVVTTSNTVQLGDANITKVNTSGTVTAGSVTYPNAHGTSGQVLTTTGSGTLSWTTPASGGGSSTHTIGESYGGGIVFYTWDGGAHGLIGANTELNSGQAMAWGGGSGAYVGTPNFYGVLGGKINTQRILNVIPVPTYGSGDPQTGTRAAAYWAAIYMNAAVVVNGVTTTPQFSDWYLPNATELMLFATQSAYFPNCNFATHDHWTSCERTDYAYLAFALGANSTTYIYQDNKSSTKYVVAIRSF